MSVGSLAARITGSVMLFGLWAATSLAINTPAALLGATVATGQLENSDSAYYVNAVTDAGTRYVNAAITFLFLGAILLIWIPPFVRAIRKMNAPPKPLGLVLLAAMLGTLAAGEARAYYDKSDYAEWRRVLPNQSAFLIPEVGANKDSQVQFGSVEYLDKNKVPSKRVQIPHMKLENSGLLSNFYVPSAQLILVDRTPYYREWTNKTDKGSSKLKEGFDCESSDSLNITTSVAISGNVEEKNAAKFLYYFGVKPLVGDLGDPAVVFTSVMFGVDFASVMDTVVRGKIHADLCASFGRRTLDKVFMEKADIIAEVQKSVVDYFAPMGITIGYVGFADPLDYADSIQRAINNVYVAGKSAERAKLLEAAMPVLQQEADMRIKQGLADGLTTKGLPSLPSFMILPESWLGALSSFLGGSTMKK